MMTLTERLKRKGELALAALLLLAGSACTTTEHLPPSPSGEVVIGEDDAGRPRTLLLIPVEGGRLSSGFGLRKNPMGGGGTRRHLGTDYGAPMGARIRAAGDGVVASVGPRGAYGNYVLIRHDHTYATGYAHMSRFADGLSNGRRVSQGEVIGYVGSTGRSTGAHLHFEVYDEGERIDPYELRPSSDGSTGASFDVKDSASGTVTRRPDSTEVLASKSFGILEAASATIASAGETLAAAAETVIAATEEFTRSDTGRQLSAWGDQAQDAFEKQVLTPLDLEKLFDGFGEEAHDVIAE